MICRGIVPALGGLAFLFGLLLCVTPVLRLRICPNAGVCRRWWETTATTRVNAATGRITALSESAYSYSYRNCLLLAWVRLVGGDFMELFGIAFRNLPAFVTLWVACADKG